MSHLPRLVRTIRVVAKYRLDEFLHDQAGSGLLKLLLLPFRFPGPAPDRESTILEGPGGGANKRNIRLRKALEELGPIYIKFGQLLSTRRDFLDRELADELQSLQDNVPPFDTPGIEEIVSTALGEDAATVFKELDSTPLASASVAQVHKATLHNGDEVVVKVTRPGIEKTVEDDIKLLKWIAGLVEQYSSIGKRLRPVEVVNDYEKVILDELNLLSEAANTTQLKRNFENSPVLYVPKIYWDFTRRNVLVMERIHGIPVTDIADLEAHKINLKNLAETGVDIFFTQVFEHNFFHADMHPGNIFVSRENPESPQYIAIDCAIIGSLSKDDQGYLAKNLLAIFKRDYRRVAELHVECGWVPRHTAVHEFESAMRTVCEPIFEKPLKEISFGHLLVELFRTAGRFEMEVQPSLVLQKTLLNVEGLGRQLYPDLDLWQTALPYLENWNKQRLNPISLLNRIQEDLPNWIDQLPDLPALVIKSITESSKLKAISDALEQQRLQQEQLEKQRQRRWRNAGIAALGLALLSLIPAVSSTLTSTPIVTSGLALFGVYLLCFRR